MPAIAGKLLDHLRRLTQQTTVASTSDDELLARFAQQHDQAAFTAIVVRHGPMVFKVCRRMLGDVQAAEDAFQAVFMVLARKGCRLRPNASLAGWLYGVACRVALNARRAALRHAACRPLTFLSPLADRRPDPLSELTARELLALMEEEVQRLPQAY